LGCKDSVGFKQSKGYFLAQGNPSDSDKVLDQGKSQNAEGEKDA